MVSDLDDIAKQASAVVTGILVHDTRIQLNGSAQEIIVLYKEQSRSFLISSEEIQANDEQILIRYLITLFKEFKTGVDLART